MTNKAPDSTTLNLYFSKEQKKYLYELRRVSGLQYTTPNAKVRQYIREGLKNEPMNQSLCMYYE
tara:strand:- start:135 stop:326 length:192 start_codon:yes stop_codon:yes gene_type:complete